MAFIRTEAEWIAEYERRGALWIHDGNLRRPHALLTSGLHSNGFFWSKPVTEDETLLMEAAHDLVDQYLRYMGSEGNDYLFQIDRVVGPQTGATRLAEELAREINSRNEIRLHCEWASPAKVEEDGKKRMRFTDPTRTIAPFDKNLPCEDVVTTGGSTELNIEAIHLLGGLILPTILALVNRSGKTHLQGMGILALITHSMPTWTKEVCPLCKEGSEAIRPKEGDGANWARLTADY